MRAIDAPAAGWYPDPENRARLRWWDGLDWTDIRRAVPSDAELVRFESTILNDPAHQASVVQHDYLQSQQAAQQALTRADSQQLIHEVRSAARDEANRAADMFTQRARTAAREITPLISDYTNRIIKWIKFAVIAATILLVLWFVFQVIFEASLFNWIGDRIDNFTDNQDGG